MRELLAVLVTVGLPVAAGARMVRGDALLRLGVGGLVGLAVSGLAAVLGFLVSAPLWVFLAAIAVLAAVRLPAGWQLTRAPRPDRLLAPAYAVVGVVGAFLLSIAAFRPVMAWDAYSIWALKAKALALAGSFSSPVFSDFDYVYSHQDYPAFLSSWHGLAFVVSGDVTASWLLQVQLAALWTVAALAIVRLASTRATWAAYVLLAWCVSPKLLRELMTGYADVPMALLLVAGLCWLLFVRQAGIPWGPVVVLGAAASTKNEGLVLALAMVVGLAVVQRRRWRTHATVALGLLAVVAPWQLYIRSQGLSNDLVVSEIDRPAPWVLLSERTTTVSAAMLEQLFDPRSWVVLAPVCLALLVLDRLRSPVVLLALGPLAIIFVVYVLTPYDIGFHLRTSVDRVMIAPIGVLALLAAYTVRRLPSVLRPADPGQTRRASPSRAKASASA